MFKIVITLLTLWGAVSQQAPIPIQVEMQLPPLNASLKETNPVNLDITVLQRYEYKFNQFSHQDLNVKGCSLSRPDISMRKQMSANINKNGYDQQYIYAGQYGLVYGITQQRISAYKIQAQSRQLKHIEDIKFKNSDCIKQGIVSADGQYMFVFSCQQIARISIKSMVVSFDALLNLNQQFYGFKILYADGIYVWLSASQSPKIFGYTPQSNLTELGEIQLNHTELTDGIYKGGKLFLLGKQHLVYILQKNGSQSFRVTSIISLDNIGREAVNYQIKVWNNNMYIYSREDGDQYITQFLLEGDSCIFVRFFKRFYNLVNFDIVNDMLMIVEPSSVSFFQINKDPRQISKASNAVSYQHLSHLLWVSNLHNNYFLMATFEQVSLIQFSFYPASLTCHFSEPTFVNINISEECQNPEHIVNHKFYESCERLTSLNIYVSHHMNKYHIYAIISVSIFSITIILLLVSWRKGKVHAIQKLIREINRIATQNQMNVEFVEENISNDNDWNDIKDEIEGGNGGEEEEARETEEAGDHQAPVESERNMYE